MPEPTPHHLMGWLGPEVAEPEFDRLSGHFIPFQIYGAARTTPGPPIWDFAKKVNRGQHLPTWKQESGDCVSMGAAQAGQYMSVFEIAIRGQEEMFKWWYPPFIYGVSRVQVGGGRLRGPGSTGSWAATGMMKHGVLFTDDPGVPRYSKHVADGWGSRPGPPSEMFEHAKDNLVGSAARLYSVDEIREALINYKMVTIASGRGFGMQPANYKGYHVFKPSKEWPHQMCMVSWMDEPFAAAYRLNSWGPSAHGQPLNGEPPGGAWNLADDIEYEIKKYGCEIYALSLFQGFPAPPNFSIF